MSLFALVCSACANTLESDGTDSDVPYVSDDPIRITSALVGCAENFAEPYIFSLECHVVGPVDAVTAEVTDHVGNVQQYDVGRRLEEGEYYHGDWLAVYTGSGTACSEVETWTAVFTATDADGDTAERSWP